MKSFLHKWSTFYTIVDSTVPLPQSLSWQCMCGTFELVAKLSQHTGPLLAIPVKDQMLYCPVSLEWNSLLPSWVLLFVLATVSIMTLTYIAPVCSAHLNLNFYLPDPKLPFHVLFLSFYIRNASAPSFNLVPFWPGFAVLLWPFATQILTWPSLYCIIIEFFCLFVGTGDQT